MVQKVLGGSQLGPHDAERCQSVNQADAEMFVHIFFHNCQYDFNNLFPLFTKKIACYTCLFIYYKNYDVTQKNYIDWFEI